MRYHKPIFFLLALFLLAQTETRAQTIPQMIPYTGTIEVNGTPFNGQGQFKFAIVSQNGNVTYWSNDSTSVAGSEPAAFVSLPVNEGVFTVKLGDVSLTNMQPIPVGVFDSDQTYLQVWFNDGTTGFQLLSPDRQLVSVPYAYRAETAERVPSLSAPGTINTPGNPVDWTKLKNVPPGFADGVDNSGITSETDPTVIASVKDGVSWSELSGIPAGFADGVDNDTGGGGAASDVVCSGCVDTTDIANGTITNDDISPSAAIASSKLSTDVALLIGRLGGQTLRGGTGAFESLILDSTANVTKGDVLINPIGGRVGIGTSVPDASALLHLNSISQGLLPPRMTELQREAIVSPATGLLIYNITTNQYNIFNGTSWVGLGGGSVTDVTASAPLVSSGGSTPNISLTGVIGDANISDTLTITGGSVADSVLSANVTKLGPSIESAEITDGTILFTDWASNGCDPNQIPKWNGTAWVCAADVDTNSGGTVTSVTASAPLASSGGTTPNITLTGEVADANISDNLSIDNGRLYAPTGAGNVGIGTTSPSSRLQVEDTTNSNSPLEILTVRRSRADTTAPGAADFGSDLTFRLEGFTDNSDVIANRIRGAWEVAQTNDTTARDSYLSFATMLDNTLGERLRITSAGNIGIGTASPSAPLEVAGAVEMANLRDLDGTNFFDGACTGNNFVQGLDDTGLLTCAAATVSEADGIIGNEVTDAANATLSRSGAGIDADPYKLSLNLGNANTWTGAQTFNGGANFPGSGIWNTSGNVGIGTTSPNVGGWGAGAKVTTIQGSSDAGALELSTNAADASGVEIGAVEFMFPNSSVGNRELAIIDAVTEGATAGNRGAYLSFYTKPNGGAIDERMRITSAGNIGIGTTNPNAKIHNVVDTGVQPFTQSRYIDSISGAGIAFEKARGSVALPTMVSDGDVFAGLDYSGYDGDQFLRGARIAAVTDGAPGNNDMPGRIEFYTTADGTSDIAGTPRMIIKNTGNVGIGTTGPGAKLDVAGTVRLGTNGVVFTAIKSFTATVDFPNTLAGDESYDEILLPEDGVIIGVRLPNITVAQVGTGFGHAGGHKDDPGVDIIRADVYFSNWSGAAVDPGPVDFTVYYIAP